MNATTQEITMARPTHNMTLRMPEDIYARMHEYMTAHKLSANQAVIQACTLVFMQARVQAGMHDTTLPPPPGPGGFPLAPQPLNPYNFDLSAKDK